MPGNDLGDRVHNFFAQDNLLQGRHHSQVVEGNWPVLNGNFWVGSQGQADQLSSNNKNYNSQNSDVDRGEAGYSLQATDGLNLTQLNLRPDFAKNQSLNEHPNLNGFMYANQFHQTRQNEANFLGMDTGSENLHSITSRGLLAPEVLPGAGTGHQMKASDGSEASVSPMSFDLFGGQKHSGINNMPQLQAQFMIRKMQELQQQHQHSRHLDLRQQFSSQVPSFPKQSSGGQSTLVNGTADSDPSLYPWTAAVGTNRLNHGSSSVQGSSSELGLPPNLCQTQGHVDLVPQQVDQSLYGVPVSSSRGLNMNHYSHMVTSRASIPQMPISSNFLQGNQPKLLPEQIGVQGEFPMSRQRFQNDNMFGYSSNQSQDLALGNVGGLHQMNSVSRNASQKESSQGKSPRQVAFPQSEVALDPTEEKILFGSDDNIWTAFSKVPDVTGEAGTTFDNGGANGLPSIQSGSWSALMQSAVCETSSSDIMPQEEWSGVTFQKNNGPSWNQLHSFPQKSFKKETSLVDDSKRLPSALNSGSLPTSDDISNNAVIANQNRQKFQNEPGQRLQTGAPQMFFRSMGEADKWSNYGPLQNSIAEGSQHRNASHPLQAEKNAKTIGFPGQTGATELRNGWNALAAVRPEENSSMNDHDTEIIPQNSKNNQVGVIQGGMFHGSSSNKSNSVPGSTMELGNLKSRVSTPQANKEILSLRSTGSVDNSHNMGISNETNPPFQNNYYQRTNASLSARSQGVGHLGRSRNQGNEPNQVLESMRSREKDEVARFELENHDAKENSNDSHHSNLSQHTFSGFREGGVPGATDSRPLSSAKQKQASQLSRKVSAPRKFQYHPMGNVDEDVEPAYGQMQPSHVQTMLQKNAQFDQSKLFGQVTRNSTPIDKGQSELQRDIKGLDEDPSRGDHCGHVPNRPVSHSQPLDTLSNATSSSQNMLELFNKVDHSRNHGATMQLNSAGSLSQLPVAEKFDGFGHLQHSQSRVSQGFGLQLGPPSQGLQIPEHPLASQNGLGTFDSLRSNNAVAERGDKRPQLVAKHSGQSLLPSEETEPEFKLNISTIPEHGGNENSLYKTHGTVATPFSSGLPYLRSNDQNQQITRVSGQMSWNQLSENASNSAQRGTAEALLPDASGSFQQGNHASFGARSQQSGPKDVQGVPPATIETRDSQRTSHHIAIPGHSQQGNSLDMLRNMGYSIPAPMQNMSAKIQQISLQSLEFPQPNIVESSAPLMHDHVNSQGVDGNKQRLRESTGQQVASLNIKAVPEVKNSSGKASSLENNLDDSPCSSTLMQKDIEAFGRSLKPSSFSHQNYSFVNQMQASKDMEVDPSNRVSKRLKGVESVADGHHAACKAGQPHEQNDVLGGSLVSSRLAGLLPRNPSQDGNVTSKDDLPLNQDTYINVMTSPRVDHPHASPQMAPSWFSQYGPLKKGQMLQPYDALKVTPSKPEQSLKHVKCSGDVLPVDSEDRRSTSPIHACQNSNNHQNLTASSIATGGVSSLKSLQLNAAGQNVEVVRPEKRKSSNFDLCPWHREISEASQDHVAKRMPESGWGKASNCLTDKVVDDVELIEDGSPVLQYKRRLTLTTCLMQRLLHSPPAAVLSADASSSSEFLVYAVSRITLGDACSPVHHLSSLDVASDSMDLHPSKGKLAVRNGVQCYAKAAEELLGRIRKLENDFSRLDKSASTLDLRIECQDLEKYSVINRFARFHGRGQSDSPETSLTNATAAATSHRPIPQRYVTALPLPRNIPDGVQCLPL